MRQRPGAGEHDEPEQARFDDFNDEAEFEDGDPDARVPGATVLFEDEPEPLDEPPVRRRPMPPPAPVVTHEGVYGTLPDRRRMEQEYARSERPWRDSLIRLLGVLLALATGLWLALFSVHQATGEEIARPALASIVETMTGLPELLRLHETTIRETGTVPGYPLAATIPADERAAGLERWRKLLLADTSAQLHEQGADAFNPETGAGTDGMFSTSGGTKLLIDNLSTSRNTLVELLLWPAGAIALAVGVAMVAAGSRFGRFQTLGVALMVGALPALAIGLLGYGLVVFVGSDGSALAETTHDIAWRMAGIPVRNGITILLLGAAIAIAARVLNALFERERTTTAPLVD